MGREAKSNTRVVWFNRSAFSLSHSFSHSLTLSPPSSSSDSRSFLLSPTHSLFVSLLPFLLLTYLPRAHLLLAWLLPHLASLRCPCVGSRHPPLRPPTPPPPSLSSANLSFHPPSTRRLFTQTLFVTLLLP